MGKRQGIAVCMSAWALAAAPSATAEDGEPRAGAARPLPEAVIADLPFEATGEPNRIYLNIAPEKNRPLVVMLDTGASFSVFTPLAARAAGVSVRRTKSTPYRRATRLGRDLEFYVDTRRSDTGSQTGFEYGLLGGNFLERYVLEIDFRGRRVRFLDPKKYRVPETAEAPDEAVMPVQVRSRRLFPEIEMNGKKVRVALDTGAHGPLILSGKAAKRLGVGVESLPPFGILATTMGPMSVNLYETESFRFASFEFDHMPVLVAPKGWYNIAGNTDSVVGYDTLRQFTIRIDYPRSRLWLRREATQVTFMGVDYSTTRGTGAFLYPSGPSYYVVGVLPDTPAARIGLRPGDYLTQPAGEKVPTLEQTMDRIARGEEITVARLEGKDVRVDIALPEDRGVSDLSDDAEGVAGVAAGTARTSERARESSDLVETRPVAAPVDEAEEREGLGEAAARRDEERVEEWERDKATNLYVEVPGGWILVEGYRKRRGPQEGEVWVTFDEMQRIKRERAQSDEAK